MNEFIEKNRGLLEFYRLIAKVIGWILIGITPFYIYGLISWHNNISDKNVMNIKTHLFLSSLHNTIISYLLLGLILLCTAKFIRYLYDDKTQPDWIIRNTEKILYLYAFFVAIGIIIDFTNPTLSVSLKLLNILRLVPINIVHRLAQVFILIGLGNIIKRVLPVIEESKTLV